MGTFVEFAVRRPKVVIAAWIVVLLAAAPFAARLAGVLRGSTDAVPGSPSEQVARDLNRSFGNGTAFVFPAVIHSREISASDPRMMQAVLQLSSFVDSAGLGKVQHFWNTGETRLLGKDQRSALLLITPKATSFFEAEGMVMEIRKTIAGAGLGREFSVELTGMISLFHDLDKSASDDLIRAERIGLPLTLVVLLVVFGAPVAAMLPLILAIFTTVVALAFLFALSRVMPVSVFAQNAVTMVGLGIGVDYALFLVSRCREEMKAGAPIRVAVTTAALRSGHVVFVSGIAVATGFLALFLVNIPFLHTLAMGGVAVVVSSMLLTVTLLPALMTVLGTKLNWRPFAASKSQHCAASSFWSRWANETMTHPWRYLLPTLLVLAMLIVPIARLKPWNMGAKDLAPEMEARRGFDLLAANFAPGWMGPIALLIESERGTVWGDRERQAIMSFHSYLANDSRVRTTGGFPQLVELLGVRAQAVGNRAQLPLAMQSNASGVVSADGRSALLFLVPRSAPEAGEVMDLVRELRRSRYLQLESAGLNLRVGGFSASILDFDTELFRSLKVVVPAVLGVTFVFLLIAFRSIVVPLKAIAMNLLAVLSAYGFLVLLFQDGVGAGLINLDPPGGLNSFIVLMLFTILFGLSMDYEVFLLSRIRDEYLKTGDNRLAVVRGLSQTGGLITSAALIMVVLFGSFGFTKLTATREFGLGLAFAVALDATLIRVILVPVLMGLFGRANWWFPRFAESPSESRLPKTHQLVSEP